MTDSSDKTPRWGLGEVLRISGPASMSMLNRVVTQFVDGRMIVPLGAATVTGQFIGGMVAFMLESFARGVLGVVNTYVSQNLGAGRRRRCGQYTWAGLLVVLVFAVVLCPLAAVAEGIFSLTRHAPDIQAMAVTYFRYMILSAPLALTIRVIEGFFYGIHRPRIVFAASLIGSCFNIAGNYALILGHWGFPAMGLHGAGIASVLSWVLQLGILAAVFGSWKLHERYGTRSPRAVRLSQCAEIFRVGLPAGMAFFMDIATWTVFMTLLVGYFGKLHLTAAGIAMRYMRMSFLPAVGAGLAATVLVGRYIGVGQPDIARRRAHTAVLTAVTYMGMCALAFIVFRRQMIEFFLGQNTEAYSSAEIAQIVAIGSRMLVCMSVFQMADGVSIVFNGALRGAGDTRWPMWATGLSSMLILVGGGILMIRMYPELESLGPFSAAAAHVIVAGCLVAMRFESGAWRKIDLLGRTAAAKAPPPIAAGDTTEGPNQKT